MNRLTPENWKDLAPDELCGITGDCPYHNMSACGGGTECDICTLAKQLKKLAAYEDFGMDPDEAALALSYKHFTEQSDKVLELTERLTATKKVAEHYETLQRNGRLQVAPCALGRTVFELFQGYVETTTVNGITFRQDGVYITTSLGAWGKFNRDVFLSSSEAHEELRRRTAAYNAERAAREAEKHGNCVSG